MNQQRQNVYELPHKAVRYALASLLQKSGNTDYSDLKEIQELYDHSEEVFQILEMHARDENAFTLTHLEEVAPGNGQEDFLEHEQLEEKQKELRNLIYFIKHSAESEFPVSLDKLSQFKNGMIDFHLAHMIHMRREELETQIKLWKYFDDATLVNHRTQIMSSLLPEELKLWAKYILPNMAKPDRENFEKAVQGFVNTAA